MKPYYIRGKRIRVVKIPKEFDDILKIQIGVPVTNDEAVKIGLSEPGDIVLPNVEFGTQCKNNAYGYTYADKTKPKELRYVSTIWSHPFGNDNASEVARDVYKQCYPKVIVQPWLIELKLHQEDDGQSFVIADLTDEIRKTHLKEVINIFLEIYGECYVFYDEIHIENSSKRRRCNWEILPAGALPSSYLKEKLSDLGKKTETYNINRLEYIETFKPESIVEGVNGFKGYYAYVFKEYCVLESALYGNATYIIPRENWEFFSQKTKKELFDENRVIAKIDHTEKWKKIIMSKFINLGIS